MGFQRYGRESEGPRTLQTCTGQSTKTIEPSQKLTVDYMGTSLIRTPPPHDPTSALCLGICGDPRVVGVSYE